MQKLLKMIHVQALSSMGLLKWLPDKLCLSLIYRERTGKKLNIRAPKTFNEKLQWLKINNRKPEYSDMVDKYEAKKIVAAQIGEEYVIPTLGVWDSFEEIDFDALPNRFVLKCTHDSGGLIICRDKEKLDIKEAQKKISHSLKRNYYWATREWPYKNVKPRIIAEKYMENSFDPAQPLLVYKIMNFGGEPRIVQTIQGDKTKNEAIDYFDTEWNLLELRQNFPNSNNPLPCPKCLEEMLSLSRKMSCGFPFLRTDFYEINGKVYFSEYTFFSDSGLAAFVPDKWDNILGDWIKLPID